MKLRFGIMNIKRGSIARGKGNARYCRRCSVAEPLKNNHFSIPFADKK
jgi:hypothetical protein